MGLVGVMGVSSGIGRLGMIARPRRCASGRALPLPSHLAALPPAGASPLNRH
jgi:hypothetical protein